MGSTTSKPAPAKDDTKQAPLVAVEATPLVESNAGALDASGEVPILTFKTVGFLLIMGLSWVQRGATFALPLSVFQSYLNAPANVIYAGSAVVPAPFMFVLIPGLLSDCVPIFGSRRKSYAYLGVAIIFLGYLILAATPFPDPYFCQNGNNGPSEPRTVCNAAAPDHAGTVQGMLVLVQVGAAFLDVSIGGLVLDYARREPLQRRGRTFAAVAITCSTGSAFGALFTGLLLNTPVYGGTFSFGVSFRGLCAMFMVLQLGIACILYFMTYEPPLPIAATALTGTKSHNLQAQSPVLHTAMASLSQTTSSLKSSFVVRVLTFHLLAELSYHIQPPIEVPMQLYWCRVTPLSSAATGFMGCFVFALIILFLLDTLPNYSWRKTILIMAFASIILLFGSTVLMAFNVVRTPFFALGSAFLGGSTSGVPTLLRELVANFVITEVTSGDNQATLGALFHTVQSLAPPLARAIAEPLYGRFQPSMAQPQNYLDDTSDFRNVILFSAIIYACFGCTIVLFIRLLPDGKRETQEGLKAATHHQSLLWSVVGVVAVLMVFSLVMTIAPLFPSLACLPLFGGGGCTSSSA